MPSVFRRFASFFTTCNGLLLCLRPWMVAVGLAAQFVTPAQALMIGAPQTRAELGRTLQMTIPVHLDAQESLPLSCVQAQAQSGEFGGGVGALAITSKPSADGLTLLLRSQQALREPILIVRLHLACQYQRTQVYTLLVDPPAPELPMVAGSAVGNRSAGQAPSSKVAAPAQTPGSRQSPSEAPVVKKTASKAERPKAPVSARQELARHEGHEPAKAKARRTEVIKAPLAPVHAGNRLELDDFNAADFAAVPQLRLATALPATVPALSAEQRSQLNQLRQLIMDATAAPGEAQPTLQQINALQDRANVLQRQFEQASQQLQQSQAELGQMRSQRYSASLVYALVAALIALALLSFWLWRRGADPGLSRSPFESASVGHRVAAEPERAASAQAPTVAMTSMSVQASTIAPAVLPFGLAPLVDGRPLQPEIDAPSLQSAKAGQWGDSGDSGIDWDSRFMQPMSQDKQVHVDEMMDAGHLAEYFIETGDEDRAMALLEESLDDSASDSFALPYLLLFDLYRKHGRKAEFESLYSRFQRRFNVAVPPWGADADALRKSQGRDLMDYDRAMKLITMTWGEPQIVNVLERMLLDDPHQHRMGFELAAYRDLLMLYAVARDRFPEGMPAAEVEHVELATLSEPPHLDLDFELPLEPQTSKAEPAEPDSSQFKLLPREGGEQKEA